MPEALVEGENRRWRHWLRMDFLLKSSDWCRVQSLDPLTGYLCFPSTFGGKKEKERDGVSPCYNFKWENYIKMTRITGVPIRIWDYYHLPSTPGVFTLWELVPPLVVSCNVSCKFPWGLSFLQWNLGKFILSLVHTFRWARFIIGVV